MNCHDVRTRLDHPDDAADSALSPDLLAHIEDCPDCGRFRERLAAILDPGSALPREIQPTRDLWPAIASRLEKTDEPKKIRSISNFIPLAAAAALAAVVISSLFFMSRQEGPTVATVPIQTQEIAAIPASSVLPVAMVEIGFVQTRAALVKLVEARKSSMAPERVADLERALAAMDSAIRDIRAALEFEPHNPSLLFQLSHTRQRELQVLKQAI